MAFFPYVNPGDPVKPSTLLENNIRDVVNQFNATGELPVSRGAANSYRLQGWNNNDYTIPAGASVEIVEETAWLSNGVPAIKFAATDATVWGVAEAAITPGSIGSVLFGGIVYLSSLINVGRYVVPSGYGGYSYSDEGCLIIGQINGRSIAMLGQQSTPRYLFGVNVILGVDADGKTHTYANIYRVPDFIKAFGNITSFPLKPTSIDITEALASNGVAELAVQFLGFGSEDYIAKNPVCQFIINPERNAYRPFQPYTSFAWINDELETSILPYSDSTLIVGEEVNASACYPVYLNNAIQIVARKVDLVAVNPKLSASVPQTVFDYPGNCNLFFTLSYNDETSEYTGAWKLLATGTPDGMYILVQSNTTDDDILVDYQNAFNFFAYYLL